MTSTPQPTRYPNRAVEALVAGTLGLGGGLLLHLLAVWLRDHGPEGGGWSLRGNGAAVVLQLAALLVIAGEIISVRSRAWLALALWPIGLIAGLFIIAGGF